MPSVMTAGRLTFCLWGLCATTVLLACDGASLNSDGPSATGGAPASGGNSGGGGTSSPAGSGGAATGQGGGPANNGAGGGSGTDAGAADGPGSYVEPPPPDPAATVVQAFKDAHVFFLGTEMNQRKVDVDVDFPAAGPWKQVSMKLVLSCPDGKCDFWDRWAYLGVVNGTTRESPVTEIMRFATPYKVGATFNADVTALQPLLAGKKRLRVFIDTWVGPGHPQGGGWKVDVSFAFSPGQPARLPIAVIPVWDVASFEAGDPAKPIDAVVMPKTIAIPAQAGAVELRSFITGHGQGNLHNCAEFCAKTHSFTVGGKMVNKKIWRDDCDKNPVQPQAGTWKFPRAGWCPGALAEPWVEDVSAGAMAGASVPISYTHEPYVNSCRPDSPTCGGCAMSGGSCMYDGGAHTAPNYVHSALLVVYARP
jgi:hypothetical protein